MSKILLLSLIPELKGHFHSNTNENAISAYQKEHIEVQCLRNGCMEFVLKRPDNIVRDFKKFGVPSVYCDNPECQSQKPKIKRSIKPINSLTKAMPALASRLCPPFISQNIGINERTTYPFYCINCDSIVKIAPIYIKKNEYSDWAAFCTDKEECKEAKDALKKKITKDRGSYAKLAKDGQSFQDLYPFIAKKQHASCDIDLKTLRKRSNVKVTFSCELCGNPVCIQLGKANGNSEFYCSENEECHNQKNLNTQKKDWQTRIESRGSFSDANPYLAKEWDTCISHPGILPEMVPPNATVKVRWKCNANPMHVWEKNCDDRTNFPGCPFCSSNISDMQFRFASELEVLLGEKVYHSKIYFINGERVEIDISLSLKGRNIAVEVDGFWWHVDKFENDQIKNNRLNNKEWEIFRIRDDRLKQLGELKGSDNYYVSSTAFYKGQWLKTLANIVENITGVIPLQYDDYVAEDKYQELKAFYNSPDEKNKKRILNEF